MNVPTGLGNYPPGVTDSHPHFDREASEAREEELTWFPCPRCDAHGCYLKNGVPTLCERCHGERVEESAAIGSDNPFCAHEWSYTGTAYGGDDESYHGEGRCYCSLCGADGDA
jgi:hypothetical protein